MIHPQLLPIAEQTCETYAEQPAVNYADAAATLPMTPSEYEAQAPTGSTKAAESAQSKRAFLGLQAIIDAGIQIIIDSKAAKRGFVLRDMGVTVVSVPSLVTNEGKGICHAALVNDKAGTCAVEWYEHTPTTTPRSSPFIHFLEIGLNAQGQVNGRQVFMHETTGVTALSFRAAIEALSQQDWTDNLSTSAIDCSVRMINAFRGKPRKLGDSNMFDSTI